PSSLALLSFWWGTSLLPEFMTALLFFAAVVAMGPGKVPARAGMQ
ncbi:hypothetical protein SEPB56_17553, partial [Salmonella enterica subsp. enterica serovar Paratyphi B str. SARA56]